MINHKFNDSKYITNHHLTMLTTVKEPWFPWNELSFKCTDNMNITYKGGQNNYVQTHYIKTASHEAEIVYMYI